MKYYDNYQISKILHHNTSIYIFTYYQHKKSKIIKYYLQNNELIKIKEIECDGVVDSCMIYNNNVIFSLSKYNLLVVGQDLNIINNISISSIGLCINGIQSFSGGKFTNNIESINKNESINDLSQNSYYYTIGCINGNVITSNKEMKVSKYPLWCISSLIQNNNTIIYTAGEEQILYKIVNYEIKERIQIKGMGCSMSVRNNWVYVGSYDGCINCYNEDIKSVHNHRNNNTIAYDIPGNCWDIFFYDNFIVLPCMYDGIIILRNIENRNISVCEYELYKHFKYDGLIYGCILIGNKLIFGDYYREKIWLAEIDEI